MTEDLQVESPAAEEETPALDELPILTVRDARSEYYYVTVRRQALVLLRHLAGNHAFYSGQLPPHVPIWRFSRN